MIPVSEPLLRGNELRYVQDCIETGWISSAGKYIEQFEAGFASYIGTKYGVAVSSGTTALETALYALGVKEGDEVIMPSFTIISCAMAALRLGATPVLVDIEPDTWNMDVTRIEGRITPRTRAIMPVHMYGHPVDLDPLMAIARKHDLLVLEDAAEVHGAEYKGRKCGSFGNASIFSFYANKIITTGEGGMVLTNDEATAERARSYRNLCFLKDKRFVHHELGNNYRMTNVQAAIGCAQLESIEERIRVKRRVGVLYRDRLSRVSGVRTQVEKPWAKTVYWMYCIELAEETGLDAQTLARELSKKGIDTRPFFFGLHEQPVFAKKGLFAGERYPITEKAARQGLYLPSGFSLTEAQVDEVCEAVNKIVS